MGLDKGEIIVNSRKIYPNMDSVSFFNIFLHEVNNYANGDIERYNFKDPQLINRISLWIKIVFKNKIISSIEMKNADPTLRNSYNNWSDDKVELKRKSHDELLITILGEPNERKLSCIKYNYSWGEILSYYDPRSGDTGISINYYKDNA